ncbi:MAG: LysR family transcriptional regulator [Pseudonocardia sp.]|nr:LysR family transcriptional regulator [Pseudonocardia sp.]
MDLDVRHMRLVVAVADGGSLSAAARALGIAQPSVSNQLRRIEESLGGDLFQRSAQGVVPTDRGRAVLRRARTILERVARISDAPEPGRAPAALRVRTFVLPFELMLPLLQHFVPGTRWEINAGGAQDGLGAVASGEADLYHGLHWDDSPPPPAGVVVEEVLHERGWILLPANHPLAKEPVVELSALAGEAWVNRPEAELNHAMLRDCRRAGFEPNVQFRATDTASVMSLVSSGAAVSLTSPVADTNDAVAFRPCSGTMGYSWVLAYSPETVSAELVQVLRDLLRWAYRSKAESNPELVRMLPAEILAAELPGQLEQAILA